MTKDLVVGEMSAAPGAKSFGSVPYAEDFDGSRFEFPSMLINGINPGRRIWVVGCIHVVSKGQEVARVEDSRGR